ncbi:MAG: envelope biogenesis factor ElyC [Desulfobacterales bacterium]|nr:envelope biogenesis factor ElyC [Desulfobacterales bacterium]
MISAALMPMSLVLIAMVWGLYLLWFTRKQNQGKSILTLAVMGLVILGLPPVGNQFLLPLERKYPAYARQASPIKYIAVLGNYAVDDETLPLPSRLGDASLHRTAEGIRIHRLEPGSTLIFSGTAFKDKRSVAEVGAAAAQALGVAPSNILIESRPRDTREESIYLKQIIKDAPFALVTSASHMPRAMKLFKGLGMNPVPAPAGHAVKQKAAHNFHYYLPGPGSLSNVQTALHEYLGMVWSRIRYGI